MVTCNVCKTGLTRNHIAGSIPESNFDSEMTVGTRGHSRPALRSLRSLRAVRSFCQPSAGRLDGQRVDCGASQKYIFCDNSSGIQRILLILVPNCSVEKVF